jgi:REP element-mobilizing transposase RayT
MIHSKFGKIVDRIWQQIPDYYENVDLDEYIVIPNHIHGIIVINESDVGTEQCSVPTKKPGKNYGLLSKIIKSYKYVCRRTILKQFRMNCFNWQRSFYDHIIRNTKSLLDIRDYIQNNPLKWEFDRNNPKNQNYME